jgi:hypothetical protein
MSPDTEDGFDRLTSKLGATTSRRQALKLLLSSTGAGMLAMLGVGCSSGGDSGDDNATDPAANPSAQPPPGSPTSPPAQPPTPAPTTASFEVASAAEIQSMGQTAAQDARFRRLAGIFEGAGFTAAITEGAVALLGGAIAERSLVVHYERPGASDKAYVAFGEIANETPVVFAVNLDSTNQLGLGFYVDAGNMVKVEVADFVAMDAGPAGASPPANAATPPANAAGSATSEVCTICVDSCAQTNKLRQTSCVLSSISNAITVGAAFRRSLVDTLENARESVGNLKSVLGGMNKIKQCVEGKAFDCTESSGFCKDLCSGCGSSSGSTCSGTQTCVNGECRSICGDAICHSSETCSSTGGGCIALSGTCPPTARYVGMYRFGRGIAPACCAIAAGIDCGAAANGIWGGCCPVNTLCKANGDGYGCCTPGLNC